MSIRTKEYEVVLEEYVRDGISEEFEDDVKDLTINELCRFILDVYDKEGMNHTYNVKRHPNRVNRIADWMMGLPNPWHPDFENWEIEQLLRKWNVIKDDDKEKAVTKKVQNWFNYWANYLVVKADRK